MGNYSGSQFHGGVIGDASYGQVAYQGFQPKLQVSKSRYDFDQLIPLEEPKIKPVESLFIEQDQFAQSVILEEELEHNIFSSPQKKLLPSPGNARKSQQKEKIGSKLDHVNPNPSAKFLAQLAQDLPPKIETLEAPQ